MRTLLRSLIRNASDCILNARADSTVAFESPAVERVLGFCTPAEYQLFLRQCPEFEQMLIEDGILLTKYWFSVTTSYPGSVRLGRKCCSIREWAR